MPNKLLVDTCARQAIFEAVPKTVCEDLRRASASGNTYWPFNAGSWFAIARCAHIKKYAPQAYNANSAADNLWLCEYSDGSCACGGLEIFIRVVDYITVLSN